MKTMSVCVNNISKYVILFVLKNVILSNCNLIIMVLNTSFDDIFYFEDLGGPTVCNVGRG